MKLPSVTQVIRPFIDTAWFLPEHAERGTAVHAAGLAWLQGLYYPKMRAEYIPYFESFRKWVDIAVDKVVLVEERLVDPELGFTGKPDLICVIKGDSLNSLPDIKTAQAVSKWWRLQAAAYRWLALKDRGISTHRAFSVRTKKDGSGCWTSPEYPKDCSGDFNLFLGCLNMYKFLNKGGGRD
jgi:hypothetical protein